MTARRARSGLVTPAVALMTGLTLMLAGCGDDEGPSRTPGDNDVVASTEVPETPPAGTTIRVRISGDKVSPSGESVKADRGKPVNLAIVSDRPGELHVHSTPEQQIAFPKGASSATITIDQPGVVDIEDHELDQLIVQLEVR